MSEQKNKFEAMLDKLVADDKQGAEELFHDIVVEKSREIYENLLEGDLEDAKVEEKTTEADAKEDKKDEKSVEEKTETSEKEEEEDKKEKMEEKEDKENKLAHTPDHDEKKEEKKEYKMSESLNDSVLLSEVQALREKVAKIEAEKAEIEKTNAVNTLLNEGKISPSEVDVVGKAWMIKDLQPEFWTMFSERSSNSAVPLVEVGHGASGEEISKATLDAKIREISKEKSISYSEALTFVQRNENDYYTKAMEK